MKPIIGVVGRFCLAEDNTKRTNISEALRRAIIRNGGVPLLILPNQDLDFITISPIKVPHLTSNQKKELMRIVDMCDGIILPGGYKWYEFDEFIYNYAFEKDMPILGICAGMQMMCRIDVDKESIGIDNTIKNTTLINHCQNVNYVHSVDIMNNTILKDIIKKDRISVNSRHNYHAEIVNKLKISAYSEDGLIEGVEYANKKFVVGIQWHPETMLEYDENANKIFAKFIKKCQT